MMTRVSEKSSKLIVGLSVVDSIHVIDLGPCGVDDWRHADKISAHHGLVHD